MAKKHDTDYTQVVEAVRAKLGCGTERISDAGAALCWTWWPSEPDLQDQLLSDYGVAADYSEVQNDFQSEVAAIRQALEDLGHLPKPADWQKRSSPEVASLWAGLNRSADALALWDQIGMPVRRRGDLVLRLWAPREVMGGAPIIKALPLDLYIPAVAQQTALDAAEIARLQAESQRWRRVSVGVGAVLVIFMAIVLL